MVFHDTFIPNIFHCCNLMLSFFNICRALYFIRRIDHLPVKAAVYNNFIASTDGYESKPGAVIISPHISFCYAKREIIKYDDECSRDI